MNFGFSATQLLVCNSNINRKLYTGSSPFVFLQILLSVVIVCFSTIMLDNFTHHRYGTVPQHIINLVT